jgi:hypothetical protein
MSQLNIENNRLVLSNVVLGETVGDMNHTGTITVSGAFKSATVTTDIIYAKNVVAENGLTNWVTSTDEQLNGLGFNWAWGENTTRLAYATGGTLWTNGNFNLSNNSTYNIQGAPVLSATALGPQVTKSNLTQVGNLNSLTVLGDAEIGEFVYFNSATGQVGINTEEPRGALTVRDEDAEVSFMKTSRRTMYIGSTRNSGLEIGTNNQSQIVLKEDLIELNNAVRIMGIKFSVSGTIPESVGEPNEVVFVLSASDGQPKFYRCIGGNKWQAL